MLCRERSDEIRSVVCRLGTAEPPDDYDREDDLSVLREAHWPIQDAPWRRSEVTGLLVSWLNDSSSTIRRGAALALGHIAPGILLEALGERLPPGTTSRIGRGAGSDFAAYEEGLREAAWALGDYYFGDYGCPGHLDILDEDSVERSAEYSKLHHLCAPVIAAYLGTKCCVDLAALLDSVRPTSVA